MASDFEEGQKPIPSGEHGVQGTMLVREETWSVLVRW
jgi:hypothetical protein